jgi:hypothetical protein
MADLSGLGAVVLSQVGGVANLGCRCCATGKVGSCFQPGLLEKQCATTSQISKEISRGYDDEERSPSRCDVRMSLDEGRGPRLAAAAVVRKLSNRMKELLITNYQLATGKPERAEADKPMKAISSLVQVRSAGIR